MSGAQLVAFPFLLLMLPTVAGLAWWLKWRYCAAIIRLQKEAVLPETAQGDSATTPESVPSVGPRTLPKLRLRILPAQEIPYWANSSASAHRRLRRRVLSVQFWSGLLYWCALWLFVVGVFAGGCAAHTYECSDRAPLSQWTWISAVQKGLAVNPGLFFRIRVNRTARFGLPAPVHPWRRFTANHGCDCRLAGAHRHVCRRSLLGRLIRGRRRVDD